MLQKSHGVRIAPSSMDEDDLPEKTGPQVADELGGRYLLRYVLPEQVRKFSDGSSERHWVTCTPYSPEETIGQLYLPRETEPRTYVFLLRPSKLKKVSGPRWVEGGNGIEYLLPEGFGKDTLVRPWAMPLE